MYHRPIFTSSAPWRAAATGENSKSVPKATLSLCFFASAMARSVPANTCNWRARLAGAIGAAASSSAKGWKLSQMPFFAISAAVASSIR